MLQSKTRRRKCKGCKEWFVPGLPNAICCSGRCAIDYSRVIRKKTQAKNHQARKRNLRTKSDWIKLTQTVFNKFIRLRDEGQPCISCGTQKPDIQYHAGHYRPTSTQSALRFNELNCHLQCSRCNNHLSGSPVSYRKTLLEKAGPDMVEWLDKDHPPANWTIDDLKGIRVHYQQEIKRLLTEREDCV